MDNLTNKIKNFTTDLLFPKFCLGCQKEGIYLCEDCKATLEIAEFDYCLCDKNPMRIFLNSKIGLPASRQGKCPQCSNKKLSGLYFALSYKEKQLTKKLIRQFKYSPYIKDLAKDLSAILIEHFIISGKNTNEIFENSVLIPVPLHTKKIRERGYNQSEELAKELSKALKIPVISNNLIKIKHTEPQMELSKANREKNLLGAFTIKNSTVDQSTVLNKKVFLVDDVYTTGSTMQECANVLKNSGAKSVWGITIAREG